MDKEMQKLEEQISQMVYDHWINHELFTWQWWLILILTFVPWFIWWRFLDKNRKLEIFSFGLVIALVASFLDVFGWNRHLWSYPIQLLPVCTPLLPFDFTVLPIINMLIYQYFRKWRSFFLGNVIAAFFFAFISEPFLKWINVYDPHDWKHIYSVPIYIGNALLGKWLIEKMKKPNAPER